jgi:thioredoxin-related protein
MDRITYHHKKLVPYLNEHYYAVKFNAEKEAPIAVGDTTYTIIPGKGRNGTHGLAVTLLQGKLAYPSLVFLDENFNLLSPLPGYQTPEQIEGPLRYFGENHHQHETWADFSKSFKPSF